MNVHVHVGESAWNRAKCWGIGHRIVVPLDLERAHENYDFDALAGLAVTLNAIDADLSVARQVACAICQAGATLVVVLHPDLPKQAAFFYGAPA